MGTPDEVDAAIAECEYEMAHPGLIRGRLNAVPALIAEIKRLRRENAEFRAASAPRLRSLAPRNDEIVVGRCYRIKHIPRGWLTGEVLELRGDWLRIGDSDESILIDTRNIASMEEMLLHMPLTYGWTPKKILKTKET